MSSIVVAGDTSGAITIAAPAVAGSGTLTLPVIATDTLAGIAATQTLTNKTLVAPALGTPASGVLTNCTGVAKAALPAGSVLQVVSVLYGTLFSTTSGSLASIGLTATITPRSTSSKILVLVSVPIYCNTGGQAAFIHLYRGASDLLRMGAVQASGYSNIVIGSSYLDAPSTTASTTYTIYGAVSGGATGQFNTLVGATGSTITLMEIQG